MNYFYEDEEDDEELNNNVDPTEEQEDEESSESEGGSSNYQNNQHQQDEEEEDEEEEDDDEEDDDDNDNNDDDNNDDDNNDDDNNDDDNNNDDNKDENKEENKEENKDENKDNNNENNNDQNQDNSQQNNNDSQNADSQNGETNSSGESSNSGNNAGGENAQSGQGGQGGQSGQSSGSGSSGSPSGGSGGTPGGGSGAPTSAAPTSAAPTSAAPTGAGATGAGATGATTTGAGAGGAAAGAGAAGGAAVAATPVGWVILIIIAIIVIIIFLVGIIVAVTTMPGMVMEKLKALFHEIGNKVAAFFGADTTQQIDPEQIYEVLGYLEDMGYDLKGYGFLTTVMTSTDIDDPAKEELDSGVIRSKESGEIVKAESLFIYEYIMSDNYIYTIKNYNVTNDWSNEDGFWNKVWGGIVAIGQKIASIFVDQGSLWGRGMIYLETQDGDEWTNEKRIKIDQESKTLIIKPKGTSNEFEYSLDGWTGRYGMPLEFLLSMHLATNMPDLAHDMVHHFGTEVKIKLKETTVSVEGKYKDPYGGKELDLESMKNECHWYENRKHEAYRIMAKLGLGSPPECEAVDHDGNPAKCSTQGGKTQKEGTGEGEENVVVITCPTCEKTYVGDKVACKPCQDYATAIIDALAAVDLSNKQSYLPYISKVTDHWYRDVYFETDDLSDLNIILTDDEYEARMKERWTLYEQDEYGNDILYIMDDEGNITSEVWDGTKEEALEQGKAVGKKVKLDTSGSGEWSAYEESDSDDVGDWERTYPEESEDIVKQHIYHRTTFTNSIKQVEEAKRTETNAKIKRIFSTNYYFKYDGSQDTAEIILALRESVGSSSEPHYGNLNGDDGTNGGSKTTIAVAYVLYPEGGDDNNDLSKGSESTLESNFNKTASVSLRETGESDTYKVKDFASRVELTKDSLSAFSMLENTHTEDADYIYKDFKELIVELGFFDKEDLAENIVPVFQWFIPDIGSFGYPKRAVDKKENMYGTMAHSKRDYDAFEARDIQARYESFKEEIEKGTENYVFESTGVGSMPADETLNGVNTGVNGLTSGVNRLNDTNVQGVQFSFDGASDVKYSSLVGGSSATFLKDPSEVTVEEFLTAAAEVHSRMEGTFWEYCAAGTHSGGFDRHTADGSCPGNYATYEASAANGKTADCSSYVSWVLQEVELISAKYTSSAMYDAFAEYILTKEEAGELEPGDILLSDGHVQINGEENIQYNAGSTNAIQKAPHSYIPDFYTHVVRLWDKKEQPEAYKGYLGGEAVVSPATGILLEYGEYDKVSDPATADEDAQRLNYDLKYPYAGVSGTGAASSVEGEKNEIAEPKDVYDPVGYAKILVLDLENYLKLESKIGTGGQGGKSAYDENKERFIELILDEDETKNMSDDQKTLYGYKEFAEIYDSFDLGGYIIYMDGFECELPNPDLKEDDDRDEVELGSGQKLSMDYFKSEGTNYKHTLYEEDEDFNYVREEVEDRVDAENKLKSAAAPFYYDSGNDLLYIKEGTVIGRTFGDREFVEELKYVPSDAREKPYRDIEKLNKGKSGDEDEKELPEVLGNYIRIVMRDRDDNVVENVEEYLKLDDPIYDIDCDWALFFWLPFESGGTDIEGCGPESQGTCSEGETAVGIIQWTVLTSPPHDSNMNNISGQFIKGCLEEDGDLCAPLAAFQGWSAQQFWEDYQGAKTFKAVLSEICDKNRDRFLEVQMEVAKEQYLDPLLKDHPWLESYPKCVQGAIMHLRVWGASTEDLGSHKSDTPEELIKYVRHKIANTSSTAGEATGNEEAGRAFNEPEIAFGILDGRMSEEDIEEWVRKDDVGVLTRCGVEYR